MTIKNLSDLRDSKIMYDMNPPEFGYWLLAIITVAIGVLIAWSTKAPRIYISQGSGFVQSANKTYIMSTYGGQIAELNISEGSYVNEGDLVAVLKSTDLEQQEQQLDAQLAIYQQQLAQYNKLIRSIQDNTNYFSAGSSEDQPYYYQFQTYQSQVSQYKFDSSTYANMGYSEAQLQSLMEQSQSQAEQVYYSTLQSLSATVGNIQSNIEALKAQKDALVTGADAYSIYAPASGIIHMDNPYTVGMVLGSGSALATVAGANDEFEVVAYVSINDRPLIHEGDTCTVNVTGLAQSAYGSLTGTVKSIDSDYTSTGGGMAYKAIISLDSDYLVSNGGDKVNLANGMGVTTYIQYDEVTYFEYVLEMLGVLTH